MRLIKWFKKPHKHYGCRWDGYYEHCSCGVIAGEYITEAGYRAVFFDEWPSDLLTPPGR